MRKPYCSVDTPLPPLCCAPARPRQYCMCQLGVTESPDNAATSANGSRGLAAAACVCKVHRVKGNGCEREGPNDEQTPMLVSELSVFRHIGPLLPIADAVSVFVVPVWWGFFFPSFLSLFTTRQFFYRNWVTLSSKTPCALSATRRSGASHFQRQGIKIPANPHH